MGILVEFMYLLLFSILGKTISVLLHLPIPGSVTGMMLLFLALVFGIVKPKQISRIVDFLLSNLALFFIPAGVGIIVKFKDIKSNFLAIVLILVITTIIAQIVSGLIIQKLNNKKEKNNGRDN